MIDLPSLVQWVGGATTMLYGVLAVIALGLLVFDRKPKTTQVTESQHPSQRRAA